MMFWDRPRSLIELIRTDLERDPGDAPAVYVEANCAAQDMAWMPQAQEPDFSLGAISTQHSAAASAATPSAPG